jgi:hypothetical protein
MNRHHLIMLLGGTITLPVPPALLTRADEVNQ